MTQNMGGDGERLDKTIVRAAQKSNRQLYDQYRGLYGTSRETLGGQLNHAQTCLSVLADPFIARLMGGTNDFNFSSMRERKTCYYILINPNDFGYYKFILSLFYTQFYRELMRELPTKKDLPVFTIIDEAGQFPIPDFETIITTSREYMIANLIILQDPSQLETLYGRTAAQTIFDGGI